MSDLVAMFVEAGCEGEQFHPKWQCSFRAGRFPQARI